MTGHRGGRYSPSRSFGAVLFSQQSLQSCRVSTHSNLPGSSEWRHRVDQWTRYRLFLVQLVGEDPTAEMSCARFRYQWFVIFTPRSRPVADLVSESSVRRLFPASRYHAGGRRDPSSKPQE